MWDIGLWHGTLMLLARRSFAGSGVGRSRQPGCECGLHRPQGYTIPLDKRLAADGRGLQQTVINDKFAGAHRQLRSIPLTLVGGPRGLSGMGAYGSVHAVATALGHAPSPRIVADRSFVVLTVPTSTKCASSCPQHSTPAVQLHSLP